MITTIITNQKSINMVINILHGLHGLFFHILIIVSRSFPCHN